MENRRKIIFLDEDLAGGTNNSINHENSALNSTVKSEVEPEQFESNPQFKGGDDGAGDDGAEDDGAGDDVAGDDGVDDGAGSDGDSGEVMDGGMNKLSSGDESSDFDDNKSEYSEANSDLISEGGRSVRSDSSMSSIRTQDLLSVDPMYIRLTKFLETDINLKGGGQKKVNVTELLYDVSQSLKEINATFKDMSSVLQKLAVSKASE